MLAVKQVLLGSSLRHGTVSVRSITSLVTRSCGGSHNNKTSDYLENVIAASVILAGGTIAVNAQKETLSCEQPTDPEKLPIFKASDVTKNNGLNGSPVWVSYGGMVYDITQFVANHPGGSDKIMEAAGKALEPFWFTFRQHFASDLPMKFLDTMAVGRIDLADQDAVDQRMEKLEEADPYAREPQRHKDLIVHSETPMNAEVPEKLLTRSFLTPNQLFYIRNHHPVPYVTPSEVDDYKVTIDLTTFNGKKIDVSLKDIQNLPKIERVVTLQCSGNRRGNFNAKERTSGTPWGTL
jgi:sulfite oxidase